MQNAQLLINNHFELQEIMLTILSKLTILKTSDFGSRCFDTLKDLMIAGKDMEDEVTKAIQKDVVKMLTLTKLEQISIPLLRGLFDLVRDTHKPGILSGLYEKCFPLWITDVHNCIMTCKRSGKNYPDIECFDLALALMSASLDTDEASLKNA